MIQKYKKLSDYAKENRVTYRTAWSRYNKNLIPGAFMDVTGHVVIPVFSEDKPNKDVKAILYSRVSSNDRKESLNAQLERVTSFAIERGYNIIKSVREIGSGMNDNRRKLTRLLESDDWDIIIVENKDRLTRFGFNYIETLLNKQGKEIIVINKKDSDKEDLIQDLVSIIYSFSARMYGLRRRKKREEIIKFLES